MFNKKNLYVSAETYRDVYSVTTTGQRENVLNLIKKYQNLSYDIAKMCRVLNDTFACKVFFFVDLQNNKNKFELSFSNNIKKFRQAYRNQFLI